MERPKGRWHQNIVINGEDQPCENPKRKNSKFWNEGKWNTFINPLLPDVCTDKTFVEVGCNAGLFLKLASEKGFRNVVGMEKSRSTYRMAKYYKEKMKYNYRVLHSQVDKNFRFDDLPVADVTLMSNMHYYIDLNSFIEYIDALQYKSAYCLIVSRHLRKQEHWMPSGEFDTIRTYFKDWLEVDSVNNISTKGDPHPREMWSMLFKSKYLNRVPIKKFDKDFSEDALMKSRAFPEIHNALTELGQLIATNDDINIEDTTFYKIWVARKKNKWDDKKIYTFVKDKVDTMYDIKKYGLKKPLLIHLYNKICDGGHRVAALKGLGYKTAIIRKI